MKNIKRILVILFTILLVFSACNKKENSVGILPEVEQSDFTVYFLDVGQADAALIICDGYTMLIDGGNAADSSFIYAFLKNHDITFLDYLIATHAHEDHIGGLSGALNFAEVAVAYCPVTSYNSNVFDDFLKYLGKQNLTITLPIAGEEFSLGAATVMIVGPVKSSSEPNNTSIVMKIIYGNTSFLFAGDAERKEEETILDKGFDLSATVLKVGHHGSDTSTSYPFLREIMPSYAVISCGKNNKYGHPDEIILSRLRDADVEVFRTDMQGTIIAVSDGETVSFTTERNIDTKTNPTEVDEDELFYIGNSKTLKFHTPDCKGLPLQKNRIYFSYREEAIRQGYIPCTKCNP